MTSRILCSILAGASLAAIASGASAQTAPAPQAAADGPATGLEEIVVTARRQAENLQDTPVSVSAVSNKTLERANVITIDRITALVPNVSMMPQSGFLGGNTAFIRGIGSQEPLLTVDSPVGIYVDGVYVGRSNAANFALVNLDQVEVLRGPQGTLFGRNTTGGAVSMTTRNPAADMGGSLRLGVANYKERSGTANFDTGNLGDSGLSATVSYQHLQRYGFTHNKYIPSDKFAGGNLNSDAVWAKIRGDWGALKATYTFDYNDLQGLPNTNQTRFISNVVRAYYGNTTGNSQLAEVNQDYTKNIGVAFAQRQHIKIWGHALTLEYGVSDLLKFKSITGLREYRGNPLGSFYGPPGVFGNTTAGIQNVTPFISAQKTETTSQVSQEFQVLGDSGDFKYVAGLYYFKEDGGTTNPSQSTFVLSPTLASNTSSVLKFDFVSKSYAAFGQASYKPSALDGKLELTAGIRYTEDKKSVTQATPVLRSGKNTDDNLSYNAIVSYHVTDDIMAYGRFGTGYRSGGFNPRASATQNFLYLPEKAQTWEGGIKIEALDHKLRFNAAAFRTSYKDLQVTQFVTTATGASGGFTSNASANFHGAEFELQAVPVRGLTLSANGGWVEPNYKVFISPNPANPGTFYNAANISHFPYVPKYTANLGAQYEGDDIGFGRPLVRLAWSYLSNRYFFANELSGNAFNDEISSGITRRLDGRIGLVEVPLAGVKADISLYVDNITNEHNIMSGIDFGVLGFAANAYAPPRRIGVDLKVTF